MTLAERAASAWAEETAGLLRELGNGLNPIWDNGRHIAFRDLLALNTPESLLAAAMMLVPEGWTWAVGSDGGATIFAPGGSMFRVTDVATPALALIADVAQAKEL